MRRHPWVFSGAIDYIEAENESEIAEGALVEVYDHARQFIAEGHYQIGSIAVRILDFSRREINEEFFRERLTDALRLRKMLHLDTPQNNAYRLVHGEGDFLPGLVIDIYGPTAVVQAHSVGMHYARETVARCLVSLPGLEVRNVYYKSETTLPYKARLDQHNDYIIGSAETAVATENGLRFNIDWLRGQKTGFFVDQRDNRALLQRYSGGRRVLNMFCYTGGFLGICHEGRCRTGALGRLFGKSRDTDRCQYRTELPGRRTP